MGKSSRRREVERLAREVERLEGEVAAGARRAAAAVAAEPPVRETASVRRPRGRLDGALFAAAAFLAVAAAGLGAVSFSVARGGGGEREMLARQSHVEVLMRSMECVYAGKRYAVRSLAFETVEIADASGTATVGIYAVRPVVKAAAAGVPGR